ncbi:Tat pathway signal protein [Streptomyces mirabilis]|uniref:golvesin C-terminal-like domain-containing protein n=2 Tax=Streptomyces mirabilis TaxID=68239 RepID=UPI003807442D
MTTGSRRTAVMVLAVTAALAGLIQTQPATAQPAPKPSRAAPTGGVKNPDKTLGDGWKTSSDRAVTAAADSDGLHLLVADSKTAYTWKTAAVLAEPGMPADTWIGNQCVIDHNHAAVAYAPRTFTNHQDTMLGGAFTAIVDLDKGTVTKLPFTASLAYFDPSCNPDTRTAAFTAFRDGKTRLVTVGTSGHTVADTTAQGQVTSPVPTSDGYIAALGNRLVRITRNAQTKTLAKTSRAPYDIHMLPGGRIAFLDRTGDTTTHAKTYSGGKVSTIATGKLEDLALKQSGSSDVFLTGHPTRQARTADTGISLLNAPAGSDISGHGLLAVDPIVSDAVQKGLAGIKNAGRHFTKASEPAPARTQARLSHAMTVTALATATGKNATQTAAAPSSKTEGDSLSPALAGSLSGKISKKPLAAAADTIEHNPIDTDRWCSVPRNDIHELALQPTPNQVEWAVDMAIRGNLHSGYLTQGGWRSQTGITTIDPQGMFPVPTLNGGGRIPAQVELGILAQESNLWQAESGAIPGQMGNPLAAMAGFYGHKGDTPSAYWKIDWAHSDCGYGVGQVTDGMRLAGHEKTNETSLSPEKQKAVALDYATNIAASLNILADKWNEVHTDGQTVSVNNDDASKPENWFSAVWNYNLGFNKVSDASKNGGHWGLGWYNNPANPVYPPGRLAFMDTDLDHNANQDAAHPQNWPYEEKVMGWSAWSIDTGHSYATTGRQDWPGDSGFSSAGFRPAWWNTTGARSAIKPPLDTFCNSNNNCDAANPPQCDNEDCYKQYWWNKPNATWKNDCANTCGHESIKYTTLINEPGRGYRLQRGTPVCTGAPKNSLVVDSVPAGTETFSSCGTTKTDGSFQFTFYPDTDNQYEAKGDLAQIGGGYQGHFWYAHERDTAQLGGATGRMTVRGTWKMNGPVSEKQAEIFVHIPDTGAQTRQAIYEIDTAYGTVRKTINQYAHENNEWVSLGAYRFNGKTPQVSLTNWNNIGTADNDLAWDAAAFVPGDYDLPDGPSVDLKLPDPNSTNPNPDQVNQVPRQLVTRPHGSSTRSALSSANKPESVCGPVQDGRQVCWGPALSKYPRGAESGPSLRYAGDWCDDYALVARATRFTECENRVVPAYLRVDGQTRATATFRFQREVELDGVNSFTEHLTVKPLSIPLDFARIQFGIYKHLCENPCRPVEADPSAWHGEPAWGPGDTHEASITSSYLWDSSVAGKTYKFKPDVQINAILDPSDGSINVQTVGYQWSLDKPTDLDQIRCDTVVTAAGGCVFVNYAPTYTFNAARYPQAAAHAWLLQRNAPNHPGLRSADTPLYYLPGGKSDEDDRNRDVICDEAGWAAANGDPNAMNSSTDRPNCDEFAFNATYNSGGLAASSGGLNPVYSGSECVQTYAAKVDGVIHLYNIGGYAPLWTEVCGRSSISGQQNSGSMSQFGGFIRNMRLTDKDAYWLDTGLSGQCTDGIRSIKCTMTAN